MKATCFGKLGEPAILVFAAMIALMAGCGPTGPRIVPVSGQVMIDGEPLASGIPGFVQVVPGPVRNPEPGETGENWYCKTVAQLGSSWKSQQPKSEGTPQWVHHGTQRSRNSSPRSALSPRFC